jgi:hypothetical protein
MLDKKVFKLSALLLIAYAPAFAQDTKKVNTSPYLFPEFTKGVVLQKGGATVEALLDYNTITQEMMFDQNGSKLVLDQADNIDTIFIANRKFIPARSVYFEKITETTVPLYVQYKGKAAKNSSGNIMTGGSNQIVSGFSGTKYKGSQGKTNPMYEMQLPDGFQLKTEYYFWLQKGGDFYPASNLKSFVQFFPGKEAAIEAFAKENNISMNKKEDVVKLINFSNK